MSLTRGISIQNSVVFAIFSMFVVGILMLAKCNSETHFTQELISADSTFILDNDRALVAEPVKIFSPNK